MDNKSADFEATLLQHQCELKRSTPRVLQVNVGKFCNQACLHCHVEAGPKRTEKMSEKTAQRVLELLKRSDGIEVLDITGGAPELNEQFRLLVQHAFQSQKKIIDRCNLTVLFEKGQEDTAQFLAEHHVHIIASLPCYSSSNVEKQRGSGVFEKSIAALKTLNEIGYGDEKNNLTLDLVFNPLGPSLPPEQKKLEQSYKVKLLEDHGVRFNNLLTITNMPIKRFLHDLKRSGRLEEYMELLVQSFNPGTVHNLMCRDTISVSWDGFLYDCDFNQMLDIPRSWQKQSIYDIENFDDLASDDIALASHCYGCTAGSGSSCSGTLV